MRRSGEECRGVRWSEMELKGLEGAVGILCHGNPSRGANLQKNRMSGEECRGVRTDSWSLFTAGELCCQLR